MNQPVREISSNKQIRSKILFVDDDPALLEEVRLCLSEMESEWEMSFSQGGEKVIEQLRVENFSVVVADLDNKNLNGREFLRRVSEAAPQVARVIFSSDAEAVRGEMLADDESFYLPKGGPREHFITVIREACDLHHVLEEHSRPISTQELLAVLIELLSTEFLRGKINLDDVPKRIRPYVSRQILNTNISTLENPVVDSSLAQSGSWFE